jgi:thiol-disulfide isomerase/thioredoxin
MTTAYRWIPGVGLLLLVNFLCGDAFVVTRPILSRPTSQVPTSAGPPTALRLIMADPEMEHKEKRKKNSNDDDNDTARTDEWTAVTGGFLPNFNALSRTKKTAAGNILQVKTIQEFKAVVVDETDRITVVRFYAPWCRACKAVQQQYRKLASLYDPDKVKFVEVPVTKDNAVLHQGLGVPSLPYGHIYHPQAGLVEELKISKAVFSTFENILETYVQGFCAVTYQDGENDDELPPLQ